VAESLCPRRNALLFTGAGAIKGGDLAQRGLKPVVLVADCDATAASLRQSLMRSGYRVTHAPNGEEALIRVREEKPDLVLVDWSLPVISGLEVCRRLRSGRETRHLPIIMVTARDGEKDRVRGLDTGADDYVIKPFSNAELIARISAVLRRIRPNLVANLLRAGKLELDRSAHRVRYEGRELSLGPTELRLMDQFLQHPGRVLSRQQLLDAVWGVESCNIEARTVDVFVGRVRRALKKAGAVEVIRTVRAGGYSLG
jgi:two-component system phosphate regulon response regulator PhoB